MLYTFGGVENLHMAKKYYASTTDLTGGKNTRALFGLCLVTLPPWLPHFLYFEFIFHFVKCIIHFVDLTTLTGSLTLPFQCTSAIEQLTKGRNKDDKENSQLASLSATALGKDYEQRAPNKVSLLASTLKSLKLSS